MSIKIEEPGSARQGDGDLWRRNPRLTGDDTGFQFGNNWVDARILKERPAPYGSPNVLVQNRGVLELESSFDTVEQRVDFEIRLETEAGVNVDWADDVEPGLPSERAHAHGTRGRYNQKCRCNPCRQANNAYMRDYKARQKGKNGAG